MTISLAAVLIDMDNAGIPAAKAAPLIDSVGTYIAEQAGNHMDKVITRLDAQEVKFDAQFANLRYTIQLLVGILAAVIATGALFVGIMNYMK